MYMLMVLNVGFLLIVEYFLRVVLVLLLKEKILRLPSLYSVFYCEKKQKQCVCVCVQAIQSPAVERVQEKAWSAVLPLVSKLKTFYEFSQKLGNDFKLLLTAPNKNKFSVMSHQLDVAPSVSPPVPLCLPLCVSYCPSASPPPPLRLLLLPCVSSLPLTPFRVQSAVSSGRPHQLCLDSDSAAGAETGSGSSVRPHPSLHAALRRAKGQLTLLSSFCTSSTPPFPLPHLHFLLFMPHLIFILNVRCSPILLSTGECNIYSSTEVLYLSIFL